MGLTDVQMAAAGGAGERKRSQEAAWKKIKKGG